MGGVRVELYFYIFSRVEVFVFFFKGFGRNVEKGRKWLILEWLWWGGDDGGGVEGVGGVIMMLFISSLWISFSFFSWF